MKRPVSAQAIWEISRVSARHACSVEQFGDPATLADLMHDAAILGDRRIDAVVDRLRLAKDRYFDDGAECR